MASPECRHARWLRGSYPLSNGRNSLGTHVVILDLRSCLRNFRRDTRRVASTCPKRIRQALVGLYLLFMISCVPVSISDPISVMLDRKSDYRHRRRAMTQAQDELSNDPRQRSAYETALEMVLYERGYPTWQRINAADRLLELDESRYRQSLAQRLLQINDRDTLDYVLRLVVDQGWTELTPAIVACYAKPAKRIDDDDRPEAKALRRLYARDPGSPGSPGNPGWQGDPSGSGRLIVDIVYEVFKGVEDKSEGNFGVDSGVDSGGGGGVSYTQRVAAWELLNRLVDRDTLTQRLLDDDAVSTDTLTADLRVGVEQLHVLARNREEVLWLSFLRSPQSRAFWQRIQSVVSRLTTDQQRGLEMRHLPVLAFTDGLHADIDETTHDTLRQIRRASLSWADRVTIQSLTRWLQDRALIDELFRQADEDHADETTEYGGILDIHKDGRPVAHLYKPILRDHDRKFYPSLKMVEHLYTGLAHYHFHAQSHQNTQYAQPGGGDLDTVQRMGFNGLVFTFVDHDTMNVDYYQATRQVDEQGSRRQSIGLKPQAIFIDLGMIHR